MAFNALANQQLICASWKPKSPPLCGILFASIFFGDFFVVIPKTKNAAQEKCRHPFFSSDFYGAVKKIVHQREEFFSPNDDLNHHVPVARDVKSVVIHPHGDQGGLR